MSHRALRLFSLLVLVGLLTSLVPVAQTTATMLPPQTPPVHMPMISDAGDVTIPRPTDAQPLSLPASAADTIASQVEWTHQPGFFDGTFSGPTRKIMFPIAATGGTHTFSNQPVTLPFVVPANRHDSVEFDAQAQGMTDIGGANTATIYMRVKTVTPTTPENNWQTVLVSPPGGLSAVTHFHFTLNDALTPAGVPIQLEFACDGYAGPSCSVWNLEFYADTPGWERLLASNYAFNETVGIVDETVNSMVPEDGGFWAWENTTGHGVLPATYYRGPVIQMPTFSATDVLTTSLRWSAGSSVSSPTIDNIVLDFIRPAEGSNPELGVQLAATGFGTTLPTGWVSRTSNPLTSGEMLSLSGQRGYLTFSKWQWGNSPHWLTLDSIQFYLNGQPFSLVMPPDQQLGECRCESGGQTQKHDKDPVNTFSGAFYLDATDLSVPGPGLPLEFSRSYVSTFAPTATTYPTTTLGPGWRHIYAETLTFPTQRGGEPNTVIYETSTSNRLRFRVLADGTYYPIAGVRARLAKQGSGSTTTYTLTQANQATLIFNAQGLLTTRSDEQGHTQSITYNNRQQVDTVTDDPTGRFLKFNYFTMTVNGVSVRRLGTVTLNTSVGVEQTVTFNYSSTASFFKVTDVHGVPTIYLYDAPASEQMKEVYASGTTSGVVPLVTNTYTAGRVTKQVMNTGTTVDYSYVIEPGTYDHITTITTTNALNQVQEVVKHHYRADGTLRFVEQNGRFVSYQTYGNGLAPAATVDGNGAITRFATTAAGQATQTQDALGGLMTHTYDVENHRTQSVDSTMGYTTTMAYDTLGQTTAVTLTAPNGVHRTSLYTYTTNRLMAEQDSFGLVTTYAYNTAGQRTGVTQGAGTSSATTTAYTYDRLGRMTDVTINAGTTAAITTHTTFSSTGFVERVTQNFVGTGAYNPAAPDQNVWSQYGYDARGRQIWTQSVDGVYHGVTQYDSAGRVSWTVENPVNNQGQPSLPSSSVAPTYSSAIPDGNVVTLYGYDALGRTTLVTQTGILTGSFSLSTMTFASATTRTTRTEYDILGRPVTTTLNYRPGLPVGTLPDVNVQTFTYYDGAGNVIWANDVAGRWTHTEYDVLHRPVTVTLNYENGDPLTVETANLDWTDGSDSDLITVTQYDSHGRVAQTIENYDDGVFTITEPLTDRITLPTYDGQGRVITTTLVYDPVVESYPATNRQTVVAYDSSTGRLRGTRDTSGLWTVRDYDDRGRLSTTTQNCTTALGQPTSGACAAFNGETAPDRNITTTFRYDSQGRMIGTIDAEGIETTTIYNALGRVVGTIRNAVPNGPSTADTNVTTSSGYLPHTRQAYDVDPVGATTWRQTNALGFTTVITDAASYVTHSGADGTGTQRWIQDPGGSVTVLRVDGLGRVTTTIKNYGGSNAFDDADVTTEQRYDRVGRVITRIDAIGRSTTFRYNLRDQVRLVTENVLDSTTCGTRTDCNLATRYQYDRAGNRVAVVAANLTTQRRTTYNAADWPTSEMDALNQTRTWSYDAGGRVLAENTGAATIVNTYDAVGRLRTSSSSATLPITNTITYAGGGQERSRQTVIRDTPTQATTLTVDLEYDALGRMITTTQWLLTTPIATTGFGYDAAGRQVRLQENTTTALTATFTPRGELDTLWQSGTKLADYTYAWHGGVTDAAFSNGTALAQDFDALGRPIQRSLSNINGSASMDMSVQYNKADEHIFQAYHYPTGLELDMVYTYDGVGRLVGANRDGGSQEWTYAYDNVGNRTSSTVYTATTNLTYNAANQVSSSGWQYDGAGNLRADPDHQYAYDGFGHLLTITDTATLAVTKNRYGTDGTLLLQQRGLQSFNFVQDWSSPLSRVLKTFITTSCSGAGTCSPTVQTERAVYGVERLFTETTSASTRQWQHTDTLGSLMVATTNTGSLVGTQQYDPWGTPQAYTASQTPQSTLLSRFGFTGELTDAANNLLYLRARWYSPDTGTLLGRDPYAGDLKTPYSLHPYQYGFSNPVSKADPTGQCVEDDPIHPDPGCIAEQLKNLFSVTLDYEHRTNRPDEIFRWWFYPEMGDLRGYLLSTLASMDAKLGGLVTRMYTARPMIYRREVANETGDLGRFDGIHTIRLFNNSLNYPDASIPAVDSFIWTITHEAAHSIDPGKLAENMRDLVEYEVRACDAYKDGPTWYLRSNPQNIRFAHPGEEFADSVALYMWGSRYDTFNSTHNKYFQERKAVGASSTKPNVGDGRPGWFIRYNYIDRIAHP